MEYLDYIKIKNRVRKILILGSGAVGKTSLIKVLKCDQPLQELDESECNYHRTLFLEIDQMKTKDDSGTFQLVDLAGQLNLPIHATRDMPRLAFGAVDLIAFVFANDNTQSLLDLQEWVNIVFQYYSSKNLPAPKCILINNKVDLEKSHDETLVNLIKPQMEAYFDISCYDGHGLDQFKDWLDEFFVECYEIVENVV